MTRLTPAATAVALFAVSSMPAKADWSADPLEQRLLPDLGPRGADAAAAAQRIRGAGPALLSPFGEAFDARTARSRPAPAAGNRSRLGNSQRHIAIIRTTKWSPAALGRRHSSADSARVP